LASIPLGIISKDLEEFKEFKKYEESRRGARRR
jgi:hypothetical protein